jgi:predicted lipoprotein with Yx(FWY)xxD motif
VKRALILLTCIAALASATVAVAAGHRAKLKLGNTSLGKIIVNGRGFTIFMFTRDRKRRDNCVKVPECTSVWPPVTTSGRPVLGPGLKRSLVGTITLRPGVKQVTYGGHPLYTYSASSGPGDTSYVSFPQFGGTWYALNAAGHAVK